MEAGYRALLTWALQDAAKLSDLLNEPASRATCEAAIARLAQKQMPPNDLKQAAALMAVAGLLDPEDASRKVIAVDGPKRFSTFYGLYMLEALSLAGRHQTAIDIASEYWGGMLDMGATTFWEHFDVEWMENSARLDEFTPAGMNDIHGDFGDYCYPSYRHSLCHGWSSGVTAWLSRRVLGVQVVEPGCTALRIEPNLGDLEWVEGTYPTPQGVVSIRHERRPDGTVESIVNAPAGVRIVPAR